MPPREQVEVCAWFDGEAIDVQRISAMPDRYSEGKEVCSIFLKVAIAVTCKYAFDP